MCDVTISEGTVLGTPHQEVIAGVRQEHENCLRCDCTGFRPRKHHTWCRENSSLMRNPPFFGAESKLFEEMGS